MGEVDYQPVFSKGVSITAKSRKNVKPFTVCQAYCTDLGIAGAAALLPCHRDREPVLGLDQVVQMC